MTYFSTKPLKGFLDEFPEQLAQTNWILQKVKKVAATFNYQEYDSPVLEPVDIFAVKSGEELIAKQSYTFTDRGKRKVIMRPEVTPSLARMVANVIKEKPRPFRWFAVPKCYRYERPQKGRLREFKQLNFDLIGDDSLVSDFEMISLVLALMQVFKVSNDKFKIYFNNRYLVDSYLALKNFSAAAKQNFYNLVDKSSKLEKNAFRQMLKDIFHNSEQTAFIERYLQLSSLDELVSLIKQEQPDAVLPGAVLKLNTLLQQLNLDDVVIYNPATVRGLDYYTGLVFEVYDTGTDINRALFGGGRYDNLLGYFANETVSGIGFGMGLPVFSLFLQKYDLIKPDELKPVVTVLITLDKKYFSYSTRVAARLRNQGETVAYATGSGSLKKQLNRALKQNAGRVIIIGEDEYNQNYYTVKDLASGEQRRIQMK
ncbi:MAG TPA: histidine--tRNA ligase [Spirochaetota bacterium]|nr:histidine--tRNA ligase [Spirochaetota bacterium]